ncbi:MAG: lysyl-tRNA synthetase, class [Acidimicrobiaceae bacterium]|nr:lysyl-tRNA synthetase, class [Acidimicrobiaceae bacterium]
MPAVLPPVGVSFPEGFLWTTAETADQGRNELKVSDGGGRRGEHLVEAHQGHGDPRAAVDAEERAWADLAADRELTVSWHRRARFGRPQLARLFGFVVAATGVVSVASALWVPWQGRLTAAQHLMTPAGTRLASGATTLFGLALILVGRGIVHRRQVAMRLAVALLLAAALAHLAKGLDVEEAVACIVVAGALLRSRDVFVVVAPASRWSALARGAGAALGLSVAYGLVGLALHRRPIRPHLRPGNALAEVWARLLGFHGPLVITGRFGRWFPASLTVLGALVMAGVLLAALAPLRTLRPADADERDLLKTMADRRRGDTLDPFILRKDKSIVFSPDGRAAIGYRYVNGVGLASGDPVGEPASYDAAISAFLALCEHNGWRPAVYGARQDRLDRYHRQGLRAFYIGDEAVVDVRRFHLDGRPMKSVRQAVNRTHNFGVSTEILYERDLGPDLSAALLGIAAAQRGDDPERGFSMMLGSLFDGTFPASVVVVARDEDGVPIAFQRYAVCRAGTALSLDIMRRVRHSPNGTNERMIVDAIGWARDHGAEEVSLNFAAFRELFDDETDQQVRQAVEAWFVRRLEGRFGIQMDTLRRFNAKFRPRWVPRCLVYRSVADLPAVGLAALSAEAFLPFDRNRAETPARSGEPAVVGAAAG